MEGKDLGMRLMAMEKSLDIFSPLFAGCSQHDWYVLSAIQHQMFEPSFSYSLHCA